MELTSDKWQKFGPAWSPNGKEIAYSVERVYTNLGFRYFNGNILTSPEWYVNDFIDFIEFDISPNDQYVAYERDNQLWLADLRESITSLLAPDHLNVRNPTFSHGDDRTSRQAFGGYGITQSELWLAFVGTEYIFEQFGDERRPIEPVGNRAIWYMGLDSGEPQKLPDSHVSDSYPTWSPDATEIAFQANRRGLGYSILVADRETGATFQLNPDSMDAFTPDWSPDGTRIVYAYRNRNSGRRGIAASTVDGVTSQTIFDTSGMDVSYPVWSRAGDKIAFKSGSQSIMVISLSGEIINEIYPIIGQPHWIPGDAGFIEPILSRFQSLEIFSLSDSSITQLTPVDVTKSDVDVTWFPDGERLAFARYDTLNKSHRIYTISRDGSDAKSLNVSITSGDERNPAVSPDGKWLIYDVGNDLFLQPLSGGEPLGLGEYVGSGFIDAYWGPNSDAIVCRNSRDGALTVFSTDTTLVVNRIDLGYAGSSVCWSATHEKYGSHIAVGSGYIFKIRSDGSELSILIESGREPSWSPDATQLAFIRSGQVHIMQVFGAF